MHVENFFHILYISNVEYYSHYDRFSVNPSHHNWDNEYLPHVSSYQFVYFDCKDISSQRIYNMTKNYLARGLQIGSGAIEAAHRNVIQKRMKQSGQRWSKKRAQFLLDLRTCHMNNKWNILVELIRKKSA
jgi:hypothetical protein